MADTSVRRLDGKVALITGAASGIGEATARLFCKHGAKVVIADIQDDLGKKVANDLGSSSAIYVHCDVTVESDVENAVNIAVATFGKLDIMHNNAGIIGEFKTNILESTQSDFEHVLKVNLVGYYLGAKHAARVMIPNHGGSIIMTASVVSVMGSTAMPCAYTSSKHGVVGLSKNIAVELGNYGIRVNCISPFFVDTPLARDAFSKLDKGVFNKLQADEAILTTEVVAEAALYLASDETKNINGHNLVMDGGFSIGNRGF